MQALSAGASSPSSTAAAGGTGQDRRARIRDQMREFYQYDRAAGDAPASGHSSPSGGKRGGVLSDVDLDSETFDVQKYTTAMLKKASLKTLVETDTELVRSIRSLDGQLQDLVYKNYAKFISATDTIRHMKENVSDMDTKLKALTSNVEHIDRVARDVSDHLQPHRAKLEEMLVANRMLRKVQFLVELPDTLESLMKARNYHLAVRFWVAGDSVLTKHRSITAFERARGTCSATARTLYRELEQTLVKLPLLDADATSIARSVIEDMRLMRTTSLWSPPDAATAAADTASDPSSFYQQVLSSLLESSAASFASDVEGVAKTFHSVVCSVPTTGGSVDSLGGLEIFVRDAPVRDALNKLDEVFDTFTSSCERCVDLMRTLSDSVDTSAIQHRIAQVAQPALLRCVEWVGDGATSLTKGVLQRAVLSSNGSAPTAASTVPASSTARLRDTLTSIISKTFKHVRACVHALKVLAAQLESQLCLLPGGGAAADLAADNAVRKVLSGSAAELRSRVDAALSESDGAAELLRLALVARLVPRCGIVEIALAVSGEPTALAQPFSDICRSALQGFACSEGRRLVAAHRAIVSDEASPMTVVTGAPLTITGVSSPARALRSAFLALAATLVDCFPPDKTVAHHRVISGASNLSHNSGGSDALGPTSVKSSARSAETGGGAVSLPGNGCVLYTRHEHQSLLSEVDRALSKASALLVTTPSKDIDGYILEAVILFVIKGLVEEVRAQVRVRNTKFQQIQVDATALLLLLPQLSQQVGKLKREAVLAAQLHELGMSAYDRTQDRSPLPPAAVSRLALVVE